MKALRYSETPPPEALSPFVQSFWSFEVDASALPFLHHIWPDGCVSAVRGVYEGGAAFFAVVGPTTAARRIPIDRPLSCQGVRFRPEAGGAVVGMPAEELRDRRIELDVPDSLDEWLVGRLFGRPAIDALVREAVEAIVDARGEIPIESLAPRLGIGIRQLQRRFRQAVGLRPKELARIRRFRSAVGSMLEGTAEWARIAAEFGFADQAHLSRELLEMSGFSPVAFGRRLAAIDHRDTKP